MKKTIPGEGLVLGRGRNGDDLCVRFYDLSGDGPCRAGYDIRQQSDSVYRYDRRERCDAPVCRSGAADEKRGLRPSDAGERLIRYKRRALRKRRRLSWDKGGFPSVPSASIPAGVVCTARGVALRSSGTAVAKVCDGITVRAAANARRLSGKGRTERFAGTAECLVENVRVATGRARQKKATCGPEPSGPHVAFCSGVVFIFLRKSSP